MRRTGADTNKQVFMRNKQLLQKLKFRQDLERRQETLRTWAKSDFGIEMRDNDDPTFRKPEKCMPQPLFLGEADFILKVRNRYIRKKNYESATKIQSWWRMKTTRWAYIPRRDQKVGAVLTI